MEAVLFMWRCMAKTVQGLIGFVLFFGIFWILLKIVRPSRQIPRPVRYRRKH